MMSSIKCIEWLLGIEISMGCLSVLWLSVVMLYLPVQSLQRLSNADCSAESRLHCAVHDTAGLEPMSAMLGSITKGHWVTSLYFLFKPKFKFETKNWFKTEVKREHKVKLKFWFQTKFKTRLAAKAKFERKFCFKPNINSEVRFQTKWP